MIVNSGHDENYRLWGGQLGDQLDECVYRTWYACPWDRVFRHPNQRIAATIAAEALQAAGNDLIGYDQMQRETFWQQLEEHGYLAKDIDEPCAMDCSAGVAAYTKAAGYLCGDARCKAMRPDTYTGNMPERFEAAGFIELTDSKYLDGDEFLLPGDILLRDNYHTACNVSVGALAPEWDPDGNGSMDADYGDNFEGYAGVYRCVVDQLNIRMAPGLDGDLVYSNGMRVYYEEGETVVLTDWRETVDGYVWGRYNSLSGNVRYVAIGTEDGSETYLVREA